MVHPAISTLTVGPHFCLRKERITSLKEALPQAKPLHITLLEMDNVNVITELSGRVYKSVRMALRTQNLSDTPWEIVLPNVLHSIRSLLSTATNTTPHERFFGFQCRSPCGSTLPTWLSAPSNVMRRRFVRNSKNDPLIELTSVNPAYAHIRYPDGRESTVSLKDLSPCPTPEDNLPSPSIVNIPSDSQELIIHVCLVLIQTLTRPILQISQLMLLNSYL